jgi:hypothetical protein
MSMPSIPGFIERPGTVTLANLWPRPAGDFPDELWPLGDLATVTSKLTGWLTVDEHFFTDGKHGGVGCVLVDPGRSEDALTDTTWIGRDLGNVSIWDDDRFESGLKATEKDIIVEFFVQARRPSGVSLPVVEFSHPFLWYWDAFPTGDGWKYLNRAGRAQELVRWMFADDGWRVEVRALEFRQFLAACARTAIIQVDYVTKTETAPFDRVDDEFDNDWSHFDFHVLHDSAMGDRPSFSRLLGQYAITGQRNSRVPRFEERRQDREYPAFIYAVDEDGNSLAHTCDPDKLGTYFDRDGTRHHYLTPIYFKREVLQPYVAEPSKYSVSPSRLSCLDLWELISPSIVLTLSRSIWGISGVTFHLTSGDTGSHTTFPPKDRWTRAGFAETS